MGGGGLGGGGPGGGAGMGGGGAGGQDGGGAGAGGSAGAGNCNEDSDCSWHLSGCCQDTCADTSYTPPPGTVICNVLCRAPVAGCGCVNHQCTPETDAGAGGSGGGPGQGTDGGCAGENDPCTGAPGPGTCCGGLLCCFPLPADPPVSSGNYCASACPA
jgi:hypothetical protein